MLFSVTIGLRYYRLSTNRMPDTFMQQCLENVFVKVIVGFYLTCSRQILRELLAEKSREIEAILFNHWKRDDISSVTQWSFSR